MSSGPYRQNCHPRPLVRLRADPRKVRVAVRPAAGGTWSCTVATPTTAVGVVRTTAWGAVLRALVLAARAGLPLDLGCDWAYEHPWKARA